MIKLEKNLKNYRDKLNSLKEQLEKHIKIFQEEEIKKRKELKELDAFIQNANQLCANYSKEIIRLEGKIEGLMEFKEESPAKQVKDFIKSKIK